MLPIADKSLYASYGFAKQRQFGLSKDHSFTGWLRFYSRSEWLKTNASAASCKIRHSLAMLEIKTPEKK